MGGPNLNGAVELGSVVFYLNDVRHCLEYLGKKITNCRSDEYKSKPSY